MVAFSTHQKFYDKYRERLADCIASIINRLFKHQNFFWSFLKKIIKNGFLESIKITQSMIFKENVEEASMKSAVSLWNNILNREQIFTEFTLNKTFHQLMNEINEVIQT